ncbi:ubiquinol-cytochrome c reductase complex assembly factor 4 [Neosynchiropus ocellatus]
MSAATGRVFAGLFRAAAGGKQFTHLETWSRSVISARLLTQSCQRLSRDKKTQSEDEEVNNEPIKFSSSKASSKVWKVDRGMGSQSKRPLWKVLSVSVVCITFLLWCVLRDEKEVDELLGKQLNVQLPGLVPDEEEPLQNKPS